MKKMMKLIIVACLTMAFVLMPVKYSFAAERECDHPTRITGTQELSSWTYTHVVNHQTCYVRESYVQLTEFCPTCGYVFSQTVVHHESHTICNINY